MRAQDVWLGVGLFLLCVILVAGMTWRFLRRCRGSEGFQSTTQDAAKSADISSPTLAEEAGAARVELDGKVFAKGRTNPAFWDFLRRKEEAAVQMAISAVMSPRGKEDVQINFPRYMAIYALFKTGGTNPVAARDLLLTNYDTLQKELATQQFDQARVVTWSTDPKTQSCQELRRVKLYLQQLSANLKGGVTDLSGTLGLAMGAKDENLAAQQGIADTCRGGDPSQACKDLASQDGTLYETVASFDAMNAALYAKEIEIQEAIVTVDDLFKYIKCDISGVAFSVDNDVGVLDVESYRTKLNELSPYYISPATLAFVTKLLVGNDETVKTLQTTNDTLVQMSSTFASVSDTARRFFPA